MPAGGPVSGPVVNYVNWFGRVLAYIIDVIPMSLLIGIGYLVAAPSTKTVTTEAGIQITTTTGLGVWFWVFWALGIVYWIYNKAYREGTTTQSIGKKVLGMHTVHEMTGEPLGFGRAFGRLLLLYVDFAICYIGVLWPLWDQYRQCLLSDKITKAVVYMD